ncbi:MAG TPA: hypothetical protein PK024_09865, partial [Methanospirillum sp.]
MGFWSRRKSDAEAEHPCTIEQQKKEQLRSGAAASPPSCAPVKKVKIPLNRATSDVKFVQNSIIFPCPICSELNTVDLSELHPILGGETMCMQCQVVLHIPGGYQT